MRETATAMLRLMTLRSNDQFNTTIYGYDDRFRGIHGTRMVLLDESRRHGAARPGGRRQR